VSSVAGRSLTRDTLEVVKDFHPSERDLLITRATLGQIPDANPGVFLASISLPWRLTLRAQALKLKNVLRLSWICGRRMAILREGFLSRFLGCGLRSWVVAALLGLLAPSCAAQNTPITLDTSETLFSVLTALNSCGYDVNLNASDAQRLNIRAEVQRNVRESEEAQGSLNAICEWYQAHRGKDPQHDLSQFISLALYLQGPPHFLPRVKEDELPPDAGPIAGFAALLERFCDKAQLHSIWERHRPNYAALVNRYHEPLAKMIFDTDIYLRLQSGGYLGKTFTVYLDFMGDPNETNARNYGNDYYVVVFPSPDPSVPDRLKLPQIRHTYLHYLLDPMAEKHFSAVKRLEPLLQSVKRTALDENFKTDISLLVTECLVRAIEIRTSGNKQTAEAMRQQAVDDAMKQGYILTKYFYTALLTFEKDPAGMRADYSEILAAIDVKQQEKAASEVQFARSSQPELVQLSRLEDRRMLITAEKRLAAGDPKGAQDLAQQALDKKIGDEGRALFILAQVAVANKNREGAAENFQKAIQTTKDPKVLAWSHVYLGRILDMKDQRDAALNEYRAALTAGADLPEVKVAAERGLQQAYEPPVKPQ
jgi:tetratricopeptide (TPR) repeat protein